MQYIRIVVEESEDVEGRTKMTDKVIETNQVTVMGEVVSDFSYSHEIYGEGFYMVYETERQLRHHTGDGLGETVRCDSKLYRNAFVR